MKRKMFLTGALACVLGLAAVLTGCVNPFDKPIIEDGELAKVVIQLPAEAGIRAMGSTAAQTNTNYYAAYFRRAVDGGSYVYYQADAVTSVSSAIEISIPAGSYDILLFAGHKADGSSTPLLLASSYVQAQAIVLGSVNTVSMPIKAIDIDISVSDDVTHAEDVTVGNPFTVTVTGDTKNPLLPLSYLWVPAGTATGSSQTTISFPSSSSQGSATKTYTAPLTPGTWTFWIRSNSGSVYAFGESTLPYWYQAYYIDSTLSPYYSLRQYYSTTVTFIAGAAGSLAPVEINAYWDTN